MPASRSRAVICDSGALIDYLAETAADHELFRGVIDEARTRYVPGLVLVEVDYFLRAERAAMRAFVDDISRGAFTYAPPTVGQLARAMDIDRSFPELRLGLTDASIAALAELLGVRRVATRDVRHFSAVRLRDGSAIELAAYPTAPDLS